MIVVGIDPSLTSAGVAILKNGQPTHVSHHGFAGHNGATYQTRSRRIRHQCTNVTRAALTHGQPDLVVIEEHPYAVRISAGEFDRSGLWHGIYGAIDAREIPIVVIHPGTHKKWLTGRGDAKKRDIIDNIAEWWTDLAIANDDEADALGLALIGAFHLGDPMPFTVKPRHTTGLEKVPWPSTPA
jgi:Holliday junction resolvasome RuvABC endonuclease subunit